MAPEQLKKLFSKDVKTGSRGTHGEKGSGLGLMLCKEFVEKNGGKIMVTSELGEGSVFTITLPAAKGAMVEVMA